MKFFILPLLIFAYTAILSASDSFSLSFGPVQVGESRIPIDLKDFTHTVHSAKYQIKAAFVKKSVQWIRNGHNLLTPRARFALKVYSPRKDIYLRYLGKTITLQKSKDHLKTNVYIPLFNPSHIEIFEKTEKIGKITFRNRPPRKKTETKLIDYSCIRYKLEIKGIDQDYLSVGCRMERIGRLGKERPRLEVIWTTTNYRTLDGAEPPYITVLDNRQPSIVNVMDDQGNRKTIRISANLPRRIHRVKTAYGFGPYLFRSRRDGQTRPYTLAPTGMLYGKYEFNDTTSLRFFDAFIWRESLFNNFGVYFAYELAEVFDKRISIVPLLGVQGLTFRFGPKGEYVTETIYPQGFEFSFRHAFGLKNYVLGGGLFIDASSLYDYTNAWIRFGKGMFWELNYISWDKGGDHSAMYGLSVGLPLISFF